MGACDELNAAIGAARAAALGRDDAVLLPIQRDLVALMGELACAETDAARYLGSKFSKLEPDSLARVDAAAAALEARGLCFDGWATPGATLSAAAYDQARVVARRAERRLVGLPAACSRTPRPLLTAYVNRVSDLLWFMARAAETNTPTNTLV